MYCSKCGSRMVDESRFYKYDYRTGDPLYRVWHMCTNKECKEEWPGPPPLTQEQREYFADVRDKNNDGFLRNLFRR